MPSGLSLPKALTRKNQRGTSPSRSDSLPVFPSPEGGPSQLGLQIVLDGDRREFVAGAQCSGKLSIDVRAETGHLALGDLRIQLGGHESLRSHAHSATSPFEVIELIFQDGKSAPSAATVPGARPVCGTFYPLLAGKTRFPFSFTIPRHYAGSCSLGGSANRAYELRASARVMDPNNGERHSQEKLPITVVERWEDWQGEQDNWGGTGSARKASRVPKAGDGVIELELEAGSGEDSPARLFWRREAERGVEGKTTIRVKARVRNSSTKPTSGLTLHLMRQLRAVPKGGEQARESLDPDEEEQAPPVLSTSVANVKFRGKVYELAAGERKELMLEMELPNDECWNTRRGTLFRIESAVRVEVDGPAIERPIAAEVPVWIAHHRALPRSAHQHTAQQLQRTQHQQMSLSAPGQLVPSPSGYYDPVQQQHQVHRNPSLVSLNGQPQPPYHAQQMPQSPSAYGWPRQGYPPAPSPSLADVHSQAQLPFPSSQSISQLHSTGPPPTDPLAFYNQRQQQQQQQQPYHHQPSLHANSHLPAPSQVSGHSSAPSHASSFHYNSAGQHYSAPPPPSAPASYYGQEPYSRLPSPAGSYVSALPAQPAGYDYGPPPSASPVHYQQQPPQQPPSQQHQKHPQQQYQHSSVPSMVSSEQSRGYQPGELVSSLLRKEDEQQHDQHHQPQQQPSQAQPQPQHAPSVHSYTSHSSMRKTPPASPSSGAARYRSPSPARSAPVPQQHPDAAALSEIARAHGLSAADLALETIGEDGESQAGTARSLAPAVAASLAAPVAEEDESDSKSVHSVRSVKPSNRRNSAQDLEEFVRKAEEEREAEAELVEREALERRRQDKERRAATSKPSAMSVFSFAKQPSALAEIDTASAPASTPASPTPSSRSSMMPKRAEGGLSALEARLARPASPSGSMVSFPSSPNPNSATLGRPMSSAASVRSLQVNGGSSTSALRARSISRASREREMAERTAREDPAEAVRRALESAGGARSRPGSPLQSSRPGSPLKQSSRPGSPLKASVVPDEADSPGEEISAAEAIKRSYQAKEDRATVEVQAQAVFRAPPPAAHGYGRVKQPPAAMRWEDEQLDGGATSAWEEQLPASASSHALPDLSHSSPPTTFASPAPSSPHEASYAEHEEDEEEEQKPFAIEAPTLVDGRKVVDAEEIRDLRKEAVGRLNHWIKTGASPSKAPSLTRSESNSPWTTTGRSARIEFGRAAPAPPTPAQAQPEQQQRAASPFESRRPASPATSFTMSPTRERERSVSPTKQGSPSIIRSGSIRPQEAGGMLTAAQLLAAESRAALRSQSISRPAGVGVRADENRAGSPRAGLRVGSAVAQTTNKWAQMIEDEERARGADEAAKAAVMAEKRARDKRASAPATAFDPAERLSLRTLNLADDDVPSRPSSSERDVAAAKRVSTPPSFYTASAAKAAPALVNPLAGKRPIFSAEERRAPIGVQVKREVPMATQGGIAALRAKWEQQRE